MTSLKTMKAWQHTRAGLPSEALTLSALTVPAITSLTQVLVKITHSSLNPGASIVMQLLPILFRGSLAIPEMDFSGIIEEVGSSLPSGRNLACGAQVFGSVALSQHVKSMSGCLAEYVVVDHVSVVRKPDAAKMEEIAGLPIAGATALELIKATRLKKGDCVLVNGASGGIGHLVLQMCKNEVGEAGKVVAICSTANVGWVKKLGADEVVDYTTNVPVHSHLAKTFGMSRFNAVIDAAGIQEMFDNSPSFLAEGKPYVSVGPRTQNYTFFGMLAMVVLMAKNLLWPRILGGTPRHYVQVTGMVNLKALKHLATMVGEEQLKVHVGAQYTLERAKEAYGKLLSGHAQGKIVVEVQDA